MMESLASYGCKLHDTPVQQQPTYAPDVIMQVEVEDHKQPIGVDARQKQVDEAFVDKCWF